MVSLEDIMITSEIDAHQGIDGDKIDIPGDYLYSKSGEEVIMITKVILKELLVNIDPKLYIKYICFREGSEGVICESTKVYIWVTAQ